MSQKTSWNGAALTESDINTFLAGEGGAWSTWTPTVTQSAAVGATVQHATWGRWGRLIIASFRVSITGTGTANNQVSFNPPVNCARTQDIVGSGLIYDASAALSYSGTLSMDGVANRVIIAAAGAGVNPSAFGAAGFTAALASGDVVTGFMTYEAAS